MWSAPRLSLSLAVLGLAACGETDSSGPTTPTAALRASAVYTVQALTLPARTAEGEARGINDAGFMTGWARGSDGYRAVRWGPNNRVEDLGNVPGLPSDIANDINASGTIVGDAFGAMGIFAQAFVWSHGSGMQALPGLSGTASIAQAINASGVIVGWADDSFGIVHAARWDPAGTITDLNPPGGTSIAIDINDAGDIVGWTFPPGASKEHAHLWRHDGAEFDLGTLGGAGSQAFGINNLLKVVGVADQPVPKPERAFRWGIGTGIHDIGFGNKSEAFAISDRGRAVGLAIRGGVTGMTVINGVVQILPDLAPSKGHFSGPVNVNLCGTIVGSSVSPDPTSGALLPVVWRNAACD